MKRHAMNNKKSVRRFVTCALLSLGFAGVTQAMELAVEGAPSTIDFRAAGYEPPWFFELERPGGIRFSTEGRTTVVLPARDFTVSAAQRGVIYGTRSDAHELVAEIVEMSCSDSISGERLSHTVTIRLDSIEYHGCGRRLGEAAHSEQVSFGNRAPAAVR
jgi:uncharacterized membrane protein